MTTYKKLAAIEADHALFPKTATPLILSSLVNSGRLTSAAASAGVTNARKQIIIGEDFETHLPVTLTDKWRERLLAYLNEVQKAGALERLLANMPQMADDEYRMQWSSTFLGGIYNELWQTLSVINIGDGGMVVVADRAQTVGPKDVRGILIATFRRRGGLDVEVSSIPVEAGWEHFKGVRGFIAASDGVAKDVRVFLSQAAEALTTQSPIDRIWAQMSLQARLTYDDRAVIVGRLVRGEGRALKSASKKVV